MLDRVEDQSRRRIVNQRERDRGEDGITHVTGGQSNDETGTTPTETGARKPSGKGNSADDERGEPGRERPGQG